MEAMSSGNLGAGRDALGRERPTDREDRYAGGGMRWGAFG